MGWFEGGIGIACVSLGLACAPNSDGFGQGSGSPSGGSATEDATSSESAEGPGETADDSGDGSGEGSGEGSDEGSGSGDGPRPPEPPEPPEPQEEEEVLERADFEGCEDPMWCYSGDIENPAGGAMWMQECFEVEMEPPFELVELEAVIRGLHPQVFNVRLQVHEYRDGGPGPRLVNRPVDVSMLEQGLNVITVDPPIELDEQRICIGLAAPENGLAGSLGIAVDPDSDRGGVSYFRIEGNGECWLPQWQEMIAIDPDPSGNWCIRGTVVQ